MRENSNEVKSKGEVSGKAKGTLNDAYLREINKFPLYCTPGTSLCRSRVKELQVYKV